MRKTGRDAAHFILLILMTAFILIIVDIVICAGLFAEWKDDIPLSSDTIIDNLTDVNGEYILPDDVKTALEAKDLFAMIIAENGNILWQERLPKELEKHYTLQDVALFTRYYLDDYPVHTYVISEGLLVIGSGRHTTWKYTLECNEGMIRQVVREFPVILFTNIALLIFVPLFIQRKWLRKHEEERTEWIAGVSHDIRTPLTLILGNADQVKTTSVDISAKEKAEIIENQALRIGTLVTNLNTSSKLYYGMGAYGRTEIPISSELRKVISEFINRTPDEKYRFELDIKDPAQNTMIRANEDLLVRLIENLLNNAVQHNPDGCNIDIKLDQSSGIGSAPVLRITDDGIGVSEEALKMLNKKYTGRGNRRIREHGIGLEVVKQIIRYHSWKIEFHSRIPHGFECLIIF